MKLFKCPKCEELGLQRFKIIKREYNADIEIEIYRCDYCGHQEEHIIDVLILS